MEREREREREREKERETESLISLKGELSGRMTQQLLNILELFSS